MQLRLSGFDHDRLVGLSRNVRGVFISGSPKSDRVVAVVDDAYLADLTGAVAGHLAGQIGIAPRLFLKKLGGDLLDRVELFDDFDPRRDYKLTVGDWELLEVERNRAAGGDSAGSLGSGVDDLDSIELDLDTPGDG